MGIDRLNIMQHDDRETFEIHFHSAHANSLIKARRAHKFLAEMPSSEAGPAAKRKLITTKTKPLLRLALEMEQTNRSSEC